MNRTYRYIIYNLVTALAVTLFLSCKGGGDEVRKMNIKSDAPVSEGRNLDVKYTDSGKVTVTMKAPLMLDFSNAVSAYEEFPEGVHVTFIDDDGKTNTILANYAIRYKETNLIDLQDEVVLVTSDSVTLNAEQLYWDQRNSWVFTDQPYTIITPDGSRNDGDLFDSNEDFTNFVSLNNRSKQYVKEKTKDQ